MALFLLFCLPWFQAIGQETRGEIVGLVMDAKVAVIPRANVSVRNINTPSGGGATIRASMRALELFGDVDEHHQLHARVPEELPAGPVRLIVLLPEEDEAGVHWARGVAREWSAELDDPREDLYTLEDGQPVNAPW